MLIDTHCHLDQIGSLDDQSQLISRINYPVITMGVDYFQFTQLLSYRSFNQNIIPSCGFHPWFINNDTLNLLQPLADFCLEHHIRVLGEIGLDFSKQYYLTAELQLQVLAFELNFASTHSLPVSVHVYKAYDQLYALLRQYPVQGVLHGFPGGWQQAKRFIKLGFKIGINGLILRPQAVRYLELVKNLPLESLVVETDAPNVRYPDGQMGDLSMLSLIVQQIADIKKLPFNDVADITTQNAKEVFKFNEFIRSTI